MTYWLCPYCKKIICENVESLKINEEWVECPYCGRRCKNPLYSDKF